jgi:hypothetical protein
VILRVVLPVLDVNDGGKLRERFAFYRAFPATLDGAMAKEKELAEGRRKAREDRLRASWIYGEDQPDV